MSWLARLKEIEKAPRRDTTKPTKPGFVGSVGVPTGHTQTTDVERWATNEPTQDPDRWCWPNSQTMNTHEIDTFTSRLARFTDKGLQLCDAEALADKLVVRDREVDDRHTCLECEHLTGHVGANWRCGNRRLACRQRQALLSAALVLQLQRCDGFGEGITLLTLEV